MRALTTSAFAFALLLPGAICLAQPMGGPMMGQGRMGGGMMGSASPRHPYVMRYGLPEAYRNLSNRSTVPCRLFRTRSSPMMPGRSSSIFVSFKEMPS